MAIVGGSIAGIRQVDRPIVQDDRVATQVVSIRIQSILSIQLTSQRSIPLQGRIVDTCIRADSRLILQMCARIDVRIVRDVSAGVGSNIRAGNAPRRIPPDVRLDVGIPAESGPDVGTRIDLRSGNVTWRDLLRIHVRLAE
jgi:hypothetical protein